MALWGARVAKVLALVLFFLPWVAVSCNGEMLVEASGFQLATGTIELPEIATAPEGQGQAWWALSAMLLLGAGLVMGFVMRPARKAALAMLATAAMASALVFGGMTQMVGSMRAEVSERLEEGGDKGRELGLLVRGMIDIRTETLPAYYLTLLALLAAVAASGGAYAMARRDETRAGVPVTDGRS